MISPRITEIKKLFADAESAIKLYERIGLDNIISAVNELRYAGEHILAAETAANPDDCETALLRAERHCIRARYDALESTIVTLLEQFGAIRQSGISSDEMMGIFPDWKSALQKAVAAQKLIETGGAVRDADPKVLKAAIDDLLEYRYRLLAIEPQIVAKRNEIIESREAQKREKAASIAADRERKARNEKIVQDRQFLLSFSATVSGSLIGLLGTLIAIYGTFPEFRFLGMVVGLVGFVIFTVATYKISRAFLVARPGEVKSEMKGTTANL